MPRQIVTDQFIRSEREAAVPAAAGGSSRESTADGYTSKVVKLIPAEAVALYLFLSGVIGAARSAEADRGPILTVVFLVLLFLTIFYLKRVAGVTNGVQISISTLAFAVWVFSLGGPFIYLLPKVGFQYDPLWGAILLPLYTFVTPIFDKAYSEPLPG
jgi:hypothetical protein